MVWGWINDVAVHLFHKFLWWRHGVLVIYLMLEFVRRSFGGWRQNTQQSIKKHRKREEEEEQKCYQLINAPTILKRYLHSILGWHRRKKRTQENVMRSICHDFPHYGTLVACHCHSLLLQICCKSSRPNVKLLRTASVGSCPSASPAARSERNGSERKNPQTFHK